MPEPDDEFTRLRAVDPLDPASLPSSTDPKARALFERITMSKVSDHASSTVRSRQRPALLTAAAAVLALLIGGAIAFNLGGDNDNDNDNGSSRDLATGPTTPDSSAGPLTPGGPSTGSCVELYDVQTLAHRELAFDGTVQAVDGDAVTFTVTRWYRGGDATEVTLGGASTLSGLTSAGPTVTLEPGARLLVAGDGGFAWSCGFTQPYHPAVAEQWEDALS